MGLWSFDPEAGEYKELIYRRSDVDLGVRRHTNIYTNYGQVAAVSYFDGRDPKYEWFDGEEESHLRTVDGIDPPMPTRMSISSRSRDSSSMVINNRGPRDPGDILSFEKW